MNDLPLRANDRTALTARLMAATGDVGKTVEALRELGTTKAEAERYVAIYRPQTPSRVKSPRTPSAPVVAPTEHWLTAFGRGLVQGMRAPQPKRPRRR